MPLTNDKRLQILEQNPHAIDVFCTYVKHRPHIIVVIDAEHPAAKDTVPKTYFGFPVLVRFEERPVCKTRWPLDPDLASDND